MAFSSEKEKYWPSSGKKMEINNCPIPPLMSNGPPIRTMLRIDVNKSGHAISIYLHFNLTNIFL